MLTNQVVLIRLLLALILGGLVGFEREKSRKSAGFKTNILVCLGATLVTMASFMFGGNSDPSRVAAQIIVGIGFLGAGTIIKYGDHVRGLTTAASIWVVACIGLAIGIGFYTAAIATAVLVFGVLEVSYRFDIKSKLRR